MEHQHTISIWSDPSASENTQLRIEVTVLRVHNIKKRRRLKNRVFVTVTNRETTKKTASVSIDGRAAQWDQKLDAFYVRPSSHLVLCLYAERLEHTDTLIGTHQILIPVESQIDIPVVLSNGDGRAGQSIQPITLYLTLTVSADANNTNAIASEVDGSPATHPTMTQDPIIGVTASEPLSPTTVHVPIETSAPMPSLPDVQVVMSPTGDALRDTDEAIKTIDLSDTWAGAVARIKWTMDTLSAAAGLHPYAQMACGLLLAIPKVHRFALLS
ncbi:hypothetical protein EDB85DRAFT_2276990 [Lactarius pseudohatsudake]|nr:hypothetical protein EDB85DRAFT_2276990 [Lactarius pseudohatsudake]